MSGVVIFQIVTLALFEFEIPGFKEGVDPMNIASAALLLVIPLGKMLSDRRLSTIKEDDPTKTKIEKLQSALIIRWACIEAPALFSIITFMILEDGKQLVLFLICLIAFVLANPTRDRFIKMGRLNNEEILEL